MGKFAAYKKKWFGGSVAPGTPGSDGTPVPIPVPPEPAPELQTYGMSQEHRVGHIGAISTTFTITSPAYIDGRYSTFVAGDHVIVELGGEAGGGLRGTEGVGGSGTPSGDASDYYFGVAIYPVALMTTIVSVSADGATLLLADPSVAASTGATIHFDNSPLLDAVLETNPVLIDLPAGRFAMSAGISNLVTLENSTIRGQGKTATTLFAPLGAGGAGMLIFATNCIFQDFGIQGNVLLNGYNSEDTGGFALACGLHIQGGSNTVSDIRVQDVWVKAVWFGNGSNCTATDCDYVATAQFRRYYANWYFGASDSSDCTFTRCNVTSSNVIWGYEAFKSERILFVDCVSINGSAAMNGSGDCEYENFILTIPAQTNLPLFNDSQLGGWTPNNFLIDFNINAGVGFSAQGGTLTNLTINVQGNTFTPGAFGDLAAPRAIGIHTNNPDVLVDGGTITYLVPEANAIKSEASVNTVIQNVTVVGTFNPNTNPFNNIEVINGAVTNCTAGLILCTGPACVLT